MGFYIRINDQLRNPRVGLIGCKFSINIILVRRNGRTYGEIISSAIQKNLRFSVNGQTGSHQRAQSTGTVVLGGRDISLFRPSYIRSVISDEGKIGIIGKVDISVDIRQYIGSIVLSVDLNLKRIPGIFIDSGRSSIDEQLNDP